jgi:hypothetical protein
MAMTASLFPFMCFGIGLVLNTIAIFYGSLAAIPFGTMLVVFILWAFISFPLALLGTVVGRNWSGAPNNPCRVKTMSPLQLGQKLVSEGSNLKVWLVESLCEARPCGDK